MNFVCESRVNRTWIASASAVLLALVGMLLLVAPAEAQATRTWVSGVGDDANPCSRTAPCKTFAGAISKTLASGEIDCLDAGGFGALTITKAITILCEPVSNGGVLVAGTPGITVAAGATDHVVLEGLDFEGVFPGPSTGTNGVQVSSGLDVYIIHCTIRDFSANGVNVTSTTAGTRVFIKDSFITNTAIGMKVQGNGVVNSGLISNTLIDGNSMFSVQVGGTGNTIGLVRSILSNSGTGMSILPGGSVVSFGPSNIIGGTTLPSSTKNYE